MTLDINMYWAVMRQIDRSDGSVLTGHMWLIRTGPHWAPDTLKMTTAPRELLHVIYVFKGIGQRDKDDRRETRRITGKVQIETIWRHGSWLACGNFHKILRTPIKHTYQARDGRRVHFWHHIDYSCVSLGNKKQLIPPWHVVPSIVQQRRKKTDIRFY